jgi:hypothetical protein
VDGATHYEVRALWIDQIPPMVMSLGTTQDTNMTEVLPRTGHFAFQVRAANAETESDWADSRNATYTQIGEPFRIYFAVPEPEKQTIIFQ